MLKKISIAIDAMGGDNSPEKTIEGIKIFVDKNEDKKTGEYRVSHHIDLKTGFYNGKKILDI